VDACSTGPDRPLVVVDAANVVGSVPDGWWRDRAGAAARLRDRLEQVVRDGLPGQPGLPGWVAEPPLEVLLVVEGAARSVRQTGTVGVLAAGGSGDDAVVEAVRAAAGRRCLVVTSDRGLRDRVRALGAAVTGPRCLRRS
jgi:hypothetical protein